MKKEIFSHIRIVTTRISILFLLTILSVCATWMPPTAKNADCSSIDKALLEKRVHILWAAKTTNQWEKAYEITSSNYRATHKKEAFGAKSNVSITSYKIKEMTIAPLPNPEITAKVTVTFNINQKGFDFSFEDKSQWVFENYNWYLYLPDSK